jgi:hypothetical protein
MVNIFIFVLVNGKILVVKKKFGVRVVRAIKVGFRPLSLFLFWSYAP